uniref:Reverse transcriptase Ty1/copia-type domain-containing protein n=1 Tax=Fagus sylvatica TaxID=28930 RepID=A0A2N9FFQ2_FAGSY
MSLVDLPRGKFVIGYKWVYKIKTKSNGTIVQYKAHLVAKGFAREYGIDYEETFVLVARITYKSILSHIQDIPTVQTKVVSFDMLFMVSSKLLKPGLPSLVQFEMKDLGHLSHFIGLEVYSDSTSYYLYQAKNASDLLCRAGLTITKGTMFHGLHFLAHFTLTPMLILMLTGQGILLATALLLGFLLEDMGLTHSSPSVIHCDNPSAIQIVHNDHKRIKHIEIDCHHLSTSTLRLLPISSSDQTAEIFRKNFPPSRFYDLGSKPKMASVKPPRV